jgi:hypothetical protein
MLDRRTNIAKQLLEFREGLITQVGGKLGNLTISQRTLIDLCVSLKHKLLLWDQSGDSDPRQYLTWTNSLARLLDRLAPKPKPRHPGPQPKLGAPLPSSSTKTLADALSQRGNGHGRDM